MPRKKAVEAAEPAQVEAAEKPAKKASSLLKKAAPKKPAEKSVERVEEIFLQADGKEWNIADCKERAIEAYKAEGHRASSIKKLVIYLKPEEGKAYYVINDGVNGSVDL